MSGSNTIVSGTGLELPNLIGDLYSAVTLNSASGTNPQSLIAAVPAGYLLTRLFVEVDANCTIASAGVISVNFIDVGSAQVIGQYRVFIPASFVPPTVPTGPAIATSGTGYWFRARTVGSSVTVALTSALTLGSIRCAVNYALTTVDS